MIAAFEKARAFAHIDWFLLGAAVLLSLLGLATMHSFSAANSFFIKQLVWIALALAVFFAASMGDYAFLRRTQVVVGAYVIILSALALVFAFGSIVKGAQNRFDLGLFAVQPADPAKLILVLVLAKYFSRRHIEIRHYKHVLVSGAYALLLFVLVFLQPDFGSALIIFGIWFGMVLVAGISWKHLAVLFITAVVVVTGLWHWGLHPYQKARVLTFLHPLADIHGTGYNAYESTIAVGSGEFLGKGIGYGTQSKLQFLPEYQTDFIFAAFAEEWGFVGVVLFLGLFGVIIWRILAISIRAGSNFEMLFAAGVAIYFLCQFIVHVGMDMGLLPITGTTVPFASYGGSHLLTEYLSLGILMAFRRTGSIRLQTRDETEVFGVV